MHGDFGWTTSPIIPQKAPYPKPSAVLMGVSTLAWPMTLKSPESAAFRTALLCSTFGPFESAATASTSGSSSFSAGSAAAAPALPGDSTIGVKSKIREDECDPETGGRFRVAAQRLAVSVGGVRTLVLRSVSQCTISRPSHRRGERIVYERVALFYVFIELNIVHPPPSVLPLSIM